MSVYKTTLMKQGFEPKPLYLCTECQKEKYGFVKTHFSPCIMMSNSGYMRAEYDVWTNGINELEYVTLCPYLESDQNAKCVNVTTDTLLDLMLNVLKNI